MTASWTVQRLDAKKAVWMDEKMVDRMIAQMGALNTELTVSMMVGRLVELMVGIKAVQTDNSTVALMGDRMVLEQIEKMNARMVELKAV